METCANCGREIGKLEKPMVFKDSTVCRGCYKTLSEAEADEISADLSRSIPDAPMSYGSPAATAPVRKPCPVCGSRLAPLKKAKGSRIVLIILLSMAILPGLLYMLFWSGYIYACPKCGYSYGPVS